jgi:glycosyltransferase involved in cell wall biosynthesis
MPSRISAIVPAFNAQGTIIRALDSIQAQTLPCAEVIVVDDASSDETFARVREYNKMPVKAFRLDKNAGAAGARNFGVDQASGDLIAFLDADDEWLPQKLEKQVKALEQDPAAIFVSCGSDLVSPDGRNLGNIYRGQKIVSGRAAWKTLLADNYITTPSVLVKKDAFLKAGGFNRGLKIAEDQDLWIRLAEVGSLGYVYESLVVVHERRESLSGGSFADQLNYTLPMIEGHLQRLTPQLSTAEIRNIRGRRLQRLGQLAYHRGASDKGFDFIWQAIKLGYQPLSGLLFMAGASKHSQWLKHKVLGR